MRFTTLTFLLFFLVVYTFFWLGRGRFRLYLLIISSLIFYAAWSPVFALHFVAIIGLNYFLVHRLRAAPSAVPRKGVLFAILGVNFANLILFKYFYFLLGMAFDATSLPFLERAAFDAELREFTGARSIILPLAISFYTFQLTAYAADVYRGSIEKVHGPTEYAVFVLFFPQLVAGPIMRHSDFFHQIRALPGLLPERHTQLAGVLLLMQGLVKKVLIADNLLPHTAAIFDNPGAYDWQSLMLACVAFGAQLYCDFSGYTDIARGLGKLLGLELPENFFTPYFSTSISAFWNNWHRTLTHWLRDYVYIPLGGNSGSPWRARINIVITLTLCGVWHGAGYNFFLLGLYHGLLIVAEGRLRDFLAARAAFPILPPFLGNTLKAIFVFVLLCVGFVLFRTPDFSAALLMYERMLTFAPGVATTNPAGLLAALPAALLFHVVQKIDFRPGSNYALRAAGAWAAALVVMLLLGKYAPVGRDFIYFAF